MAKKTYYRAMSRDKDIESIKIKILKLHALAESGNTYEAENARAMLEKWLRQYGLTLDEILSEKEEVRWCDFKARNEVERKILFQCYFKVKNVGKLQYRKYKDEISFELTSYEFAEIANYYEWHRKQLTKELKALQKDFIEAYIIKHHLTAQTSGEYDDKELTPDQKAHLIKILTLMRTVENKSFRKLLEQ